MLVQSKIKLFIFITKIFMVTGTINREQLVVKIFSDSLACAKLKCTKIHMQYYNAVEDCLSENYLTRKIIAQNILDTKYSFMVLPQNPAITPTFVHASIGQQWGGGIYVGSLHFRVMTITNRQMPLVRDLCTLAAKLKKNKA